MKGSIEFSKVVSNTPRISGELDSKKDLQPAKLKQDETLHKNLKSL